MLFLYVFIVAKDENEDEACAELSVHERLAETIRGDLIAEFGSFDDELQILCRATVWRLSHVR